MPPDELGPIVVVAVPVLVLYALSRVTGWQRLAGRYPSLGMPPEPRTRFGYGVFRGWLGYNNDWRSTFAGANDHEADWEQCFVFLEEGEDGSTTPVWFARAAHDEVGADLRRRWDDPILVREGDHPVIFAGAGSHAAYIEQGEYLQSVTLRLPARIRAISDLLRQFWSETLRQGRGPTAETSGDVAAVPFVDYARGDGVAVGPAQPDAWTPIPIGDETPWVSGYDGLFGLDTYDRFAGERTGCARTTSG